MRTRDKHTRLVKAASGLALMASLAGCYTTTMRSGLPANAARIEYDKRWHHGVIWGIAELSGPYNLKEVCPQGWAEISTETSFLAGLLYAVTSGVYAPQTVTVRCSGDEPEQDTEEDEDSDEEAALQRERTSGRF